MRAWNDLRPAAKTLIEIAVATDRQPHDVIRRLADILEHGIEAVRGRMTGSAAAPLGGWPFTGHRTLADVPVTPIFVGVDLATKPDVTCFLKVAPDE